MFIRYRKKPHTLQKLDALIPRLANNHKQLPKLKEDAAKLQRGYNGERRLDYYLRSLTKEFYILNDVSLKIWNKQFQIDSLIISPHSLYMIEVKNFEGTLTFDTTHKQLIQTIRHQETSYTYPLTQAENTVYLMMQWLQYNQLPSIPIHSYIVLAESSTIVRVKGDEAIIAKYVMKAEEVILRILQIEETYEAHQKGNIQRRNQITNMMMEHMHDFSIDVMKKYDIQESEVKRGVRCVECGQINMNYDYGKWTCQNCSIRSRNAHEITLYDYFLLNKNDITVSDAMEFLGLDSRHKTYRILKRSKVVYQKSTKSWIRNNYRE